MQVKTATGHFITGYFATCNRSVHTKRAYSFDLAQFVEFARPRTRIQSLDANLIESWCHQLRLLGYAPASIRRKLASLSVFFRYWLRRGKLSNSPMWQLRIRLDSTRTLPRCLTESETSSLLLAAENQVAEIDLAQAPRLDRRFIALRNLALVELLFATGIRVGEASSLSLGDFCAVESSFKITGKGRRVRLAFLTEAACIRSQESYLAVRRAIPSSSSALFLNLAGTRLSTQGIAYAIRRLAGKASIERTVTPHMLRHTSATLFLRNGADLRTVQEFLGHASVATTQRYTHITKDHLLSTLRRCHPMKSLRERSSETTPGRASTA